MDSNNSSEENIEETEEIEDETSKTSVFDFEWGQDYRKLESMRKVLSQDETVDFPKHTFEAQEAQEEINSENESEPDVPHQEAQEVQEEINSDNEPEPDVANQVNSEDDNEIENETEKKTSFFRLPSIIRPPKRKK